jgi:hypothetical protein
VGTFLPTHGSNLIISLYIAGTARGCHTDRNTGLHDSRFFLAGAQLASIIDANRDPQIERLKGDESRSQAFNNLCDIDNIEPDSAHDAWTIVGQLRDSQERDENHLQHQGPVISVAGTASSANGENGDQSSETGFQVSGQLCVVEPVDKKSHFIVDCALLVLAAPFSARLS